MTATIVGAWLLAAVTVVRHVGLGSFLPARPIASSTTVVQVELAGRHAGGTPTEAARDRRRWAASVGIAVVLWLAFGVPALVCVGAGFALQQWWRRRRSSRRSSLAVADELPDVTDLLALAVDAGLTVHLALDAVSRHGTGRIALAFESVLDQVSRGARLVDELEAVRTLGPPVDPLVDALIAAERYGIPLAPALALIAAEGRAARRRRLEEEARKVPVRLLFPLVCCILPSVGLLTIVPVAGAALDGLALPSP